jgi:hypothetical protein
MAEGAIQPYDYINDSYGVACLQAAQDSKSDIMRFGAALVNSMGEIISTGRNRQVFRAATHEGKLRSPEYIMLGGNVAYAVHAEQDAIFQALLRGYSVEQTQLYILGFSPNPLTFGKLSIVLPDVFTCKVCPNTMLRFGIPVNIPTLLGWQLLAPHEAKKSAESQQGHWGRFTVDENRSLIAA